MTAYLILTGIVSLHAFINSARRLRSKEYPFVMTIPMSRTLELTHLVVRLMLCTWAAYLILS